MIFQVLNGQSAWNKLNRWEQPVWLVVRPGLHNAEGFRIFTTTLETTELVDDRYILKPVLKTKLFFEEITVLA